MIKNHRCIFVSDIHMGMWESHANLLLNFLQHNTAPTIYLVGDVFDFWALNRMERHWPPVYTDLIRHLHSLNAQGITIYYLVGNHDEFLDACKGQYGTFYIGDQVIHETFDGKKMLVMHGHQVDFVSQKMHWLEMLGDYMYDWALRLNEHLAKIRHKLGLKYWSFSAWCKQKVKSVLTYIEGFQKALEVEAKKHGCVGVICGHIHTPAIKQDGDFLYVNCGDWVESMSAIVEDEYGNFEIVYWPDRK